MAEPGERTALPLAQAAEHLGISPNALRMRVARGRAEGVRREGRLYVYVDAPPPAARPPTPPAAEPAVHGALLELQRTELNRLLAENRRLNERYEQLLELLRAEQTQRQSLQDIILELARDRTLPGLDQILSRLDRLEATGHALRHTLRQLADNAKRSDRQLAGMRGFEARLATVERDGLMIRRALAQIADLLARPRR